MTRFLVTETWFKDYMNDSNVSINGFNCERNDRVGRRGGGVVCFVKCELPYTRLIELESDPFKVLWARVQPFKMPRKFSCIIFVCLYHPPDAAMRDYLIHSIDSVLRKYPESGIVISGEFNQLRDSFLRTHYRFKQVVQAPTRGLAILDKLWTNMYDMYEVPYVLSQLGTSGHNGILWKPIPGRCIELGKCKTVSIRCIGGETLCGKYFNKVKNVNQLHRLLPARRTVHHDTRNTNIYLTPDVRTERYKRSLIPWGLYNWQ